MRKLWKVLSLILLLFLMLSQISIVSAASKDHNDKLKDIEQYIKETMEKEKIPGLEVVVIDNGNTILKSGYGYENIKTEKPVTNSTLFEIGSNSKAFTALAILQLEEQGFLSLDDEIIKYIPWLKMYYNHQEVTDLTLRNLLHHTSGIPFKTIGDIPIDDSKKALENTVRNLVGVELNNSPGQSFEYATINYDILGLIIENITGQSYESYIYSNILEPLGLKNTYLNYEHLPTSIATGYKINFATPSEYNAPIYRGNTPAGYFISNIDDIERWTKINLGLIHSEKISSKTIEMLHNPNRSIPPNIDGSSYALGWNVYQKGSGEVSHGGNNPNYSSYILMRPEEKTAVAVLSNINSDNTEIVARNIFNLLQNDELLPTRSELNKNIDSLSIVIMAICIPLILYITISIINRILGIIRGLVNFKGLNRKNAVYCLVSFIALGIFIYSIYFIPSAFFKELPWSFLDVWFPESFELAIQTLYITGVLFFLSAVFSIFFSKQNEKEYLNLIVLSLISGFGNTFIIFILNESLFMKREGISNLFYYFLLGVLLYVIAQLVSRRKLIAITNNLVYEKRMDIISKVLRSSYFKFENIENSKIYSSLNQDTVMVSTFANSLITVITNAITLTFCFIYLGLVNLYGFLLSVFIIFFTVSIYFLLGRKANKLFEETRNLQNVYYTFIQNMLNGFKELFLHNSKRNEFEQDFKEHCDIYREKKVKGDQRYASLFIFGELLFVSVIGFVTFIFPVIFKDFSSLNLNSYVFVFLYMTGPVNVILNSVPNLFRIRISWNRINNLLKDLRETKSEHNHDNSSEITGNYELILQNVKFNYKNENQNENFGIGPINLRFYPGEVTFITGGNGSGKSTLAKILSGLYSPQNGEIYIKSNNKKYGINQSTSTVFTDFHLFNKLYGVYPKIEVVNEYLKLLKLEDKVNIKNRKLSTVNLSTGQRKRLALLISLVEERSILIFDEWAAEQDPDFREFFYTEILPMLKKKNHCVIVITHDDGYYHFADKLIKMELGKISNIEVENDRGNIQNVQVYRNY
ncbi:cyclic peptide export ABC transporter [Bacillus pseudomycoides]|uniref:cyclic peptide export ABC transporter n=1 Tax=Bacillus pseudomycoides TaxID=64104 RepID=UPI003D255098